MSHRPSRSGNQVPWRLAGGRGRIVAVAVHAGHEVRPEVAPLLAVDAGTRLREEDPYTDQWANLADARAVVLRSRFEVDMNRPRDRAVYVQPEDAWGLRVWHKPLPQAIVTESLRLYDEFYSALDQLLSEVKRRHGPFVVLDLHSYNHRRNGPDGPDGDPGLNPQVNVGTGSMDRTRWEAVVSRFISDLGRFALAGGPLDVRENIRFQGGHLPQWVHERFPTTGCALAIEFKKFFMDEWTGKPDRNCVKAIGDALRSTLPGLREELARL